MKWYTWCHHTGERKGEWTRILRHRWTRTEGREHGPEGKRGSRKVRSIGQRWGNKEVKQHIARNPHLVRQGCHKKGQWQQHQWSIQNTVGMGSQGLSAHSESRAGSSQLLYKTPM